ncbi:hypothetical protein HNY73_006218 [Argiope bruennichi]|uniref:Uncharacterized protein n=1 Tax=Argiope bruennichi TaxID=94029 RepID=A0A8T0FK03_ARGBR|nr:hypothetical protein HNY73_006218 [Argiope bruennichi]
MELKKQFSFLICIFIALECYVNILAQDVSPENRIAISPLAIGGMLQGLLNMQIRPEGGFYEEKYKQIFKDDDEKLHSVTYESILHLSESDISELAEKYDPQEILSNDGKQLKGALQGKNENPCFDEDKITKNRLLGLMCSLKLLNELRRH